MKYVEVNNLFADVLTHTVLYILHQTLTPGQQKFSLLYKQENYFLMSQQ
jgi:hypothetical protein